MKIKTKKGCFLTNSLVNYLSLCFIKIVVLNRVNFGENNKKKIGGFRIMVVKNSKGISLISLIITIIVIIILAAIVIFSGMSTPEKAQLAKVITDIENVQAAVDQAYYGLYTEKAVLGEVWTDSQYYEAVATGELDRANLNSTELKLIGDNNLVDINLPVYEGRNWYLALTDMSDTIKTGSVVLN